MGKGTILFRSIFSSNEDNFKLTEDNLKQTVDKIRHSLYPSQVKVHAGSLSHCVLLLLPGNHALASLANLAESTFLVAEQKK